MRTLKDAALNDVGMDGPPGFKADRPSPFGLLAASVLALPIRAYRLILSPWVGMYCRFQPTCSAYALEALERHGPIRGTWLTLNRLSRCRPGAAWGYDPVPGRCGCCASRYGPGEGPADGPADGPGNGPGSGDATPSQREAEELAAQLPR